MAIFKYTIGSIFLVISMFSCDEKRIVNDKSHNQETPKALQTESVGLEKSMRYNKGDLVEMLYQELVENTPELKKLEAAMVELDNNSNDIKEVHQQYKGKSENYYNSAKYKTSEIGDSVLRKKIDKIIKNSNEKYTSKVSDMSYLLNEISKKETTLRDHHTILKIVLTLPLIENYQNQNKPDKKALKQLLNQTDKLILRTDSLTPKY